MAPDEEGDSNSMSSGGEPMPASLEVGTDSSSVRAPLAAPVPRERRPVFSSAC